MPERVEGRDRVGGRAAEIIWRWELRDEENLKETEWQSQAGARRRE